MLNVRRIFPAAALVIAVTACGGSDGGTAETVPADTTATSAVDGAVAENESSTPDRPSDTLVAPTDTAGATTDTVAAPTDTVDAGAVDEGGAADAQIVTAALVEWAVEAPTVYTAGEITFVASNNGSFPHELVVIQGEGYESLPLAEGGAVIEDELPTGALIARTGRLGGGSTEDLTVTLAPGNYVLVCNLGGGGSSHAGQGQRLDITVT